MVFGAVEHFSDNQNSLRVPSGRTTGFLAGASLMTRRVFSSVGFFRTDLQVGELIDWFARGKAEKIPYTISDELALLRRVHAMSTTAQATKTVTKTGATARADYLKVVRSWLTD